MEPSSEAEPNKDQENEKESETLEEKEQNENEPINNGDEVRNRMDMDNQDQTHGESSIKMEAVEMEEPTEKFKQKAPPINCIEKIVFFMDVSSEMANPSLNQTKIRSQSFLEYVQKTLQIFLTTKKTLNPLHQYALALLQNGSVFWYQEFTNDNKLIEEIISQLEPEEVDESDKEKVFSFDHIVQILNDHCELPKVTDIIFPPPYIVRCILIYGRSNCLIEISPEKREMFQQFKKSPFFFIDILYIHDIPSPENNSQAIYNFFCDLDKDETGYVLEVSNSIQRLYENMAKLLCHPLQRSAQNEAFFDLIPPESSNLLSEIR